MSYSLNQIITREDCEALLNAAQLERQDIELRRLQQEKQYRQVTMGTTGIDAALAAVITERAAVETVVAGLPEGTTKEQMSKRLMVLNLKKVQLEDRREKYGVLALLQKEYAIATINKEIVENDSYVDALNQRMREL